MAKYRNDNPDQTRMFALSLDKQLSPNTLEYTIHHIVENLDLSMIDSRYKNDEIGRKAIDPKILLKTILLGYSRGLISSRQIERACRENIIFMTMTCGDVPDHSTIATFVSSMEEEITQIFTQVLLVCDEEGLLGGTHFSIDGVKLPSNASKECSGKFDELKSKKENIERKVKEAIKEHNDEDKVKSGKKDDDHEHRIRKLKQKAEKIDKFLKENEPRKGSSGKEVQSNTTDNESAKMVTSHGVVQGYNANAIVDEKTQVITYAEAFGENEDSVHTMPMIEGAANQLENLGYKEPLKEKIITADSSYYSTKSITFCEEYGVDAYIPDSKFRKRDPRLRDADKYKRATNKDKTNHRKGKGLFTVKDFTFNDNGRLICPAGAALYIRNRNFKTKQGWKGINYRAPITACRNCNLRSKCLRKPETESRQVHIFYESGFGNITERMRRKIDSASGRKTYSKRLGIVEPVFANIRARKRMDRFTLRGRVKVNIQWRLYCLVHNIEKIINFGNSSFITA